MKGKLYLKITVFTLVMFFGATVWAFKPDIHEDICARIISGISRTVDSETLNFKEKAIIEIRRANRETDTSLAGFLASYKHFDAEEFERASQHLVTMREDVISRITASSPDGRRARKSLGTALHTLQDFYAHSNWVETGRSDINNDLGRVTMANPPATTAFCPNDPEVLSGPGLTDLTSGYYIGLLGCGPLPINGKCYHGGPGGCDGINKDFPGRTGYDTARSLANTATTDYLDQILDATGVADNAKAIKALMRINGTLGMVIDDTGSMGGEINQVKAQVAQIVAALSGTDNEPDEYLLVRFGDPDVGPPLTTTDSGDYLSMVNTLYPHGGGDCPEYSQTGLLQAIGASRFDSKLFTFTDASPKDASLANLVSAAAQAKRINITALLTGSCSPISPAYYQNVEDTGGQMFILSPAEVGKAFDLVRPQIFGDFVTISRIKGTFDGTPKQLVALIDSSISTAVFSATMDSKSSVTLVRPDGTPVQATDPGVTITDLYYGTIITVDDPVPGQWAFSTLGSGSFTMVAQANSPLDLYIFEFVEAFDPAKAYRAIAGQPIVDTLPTAQAHLIGPYLSANFRLVDECGTTINPLALISGDPYAALDEFAGPVPLPDVPFRVAVSGIDEHGEQYERLYPTLFRAQTVKVSLDAETAVDYLPVGVTTSLRFIVQNLGDNATFRMAAIDNQSFISRAVPVQLTLNTGESAIFEVDLYPPEGVAEDIEDSLTVTATSTSNSAVTNSDTVEMLTIPGNQPPDCSPAAGVQIDLWSPNHEMVSIDVLAVTGITDPDGDPVSIAIKSITQDESVCNDSGSGTTAPDGSGLGTGVAEIRAERDGSGNGRVYHVNFEANDGRNGTCDGTIVITVPHSQNGELAIDDGQSYDSTQF